MLQGKKPQDAIGLLYTDAKGEQVPYRKGDLFYDLDHKYLITVDTSNSINEEGVQYDFACVADVQEYFNKEKLTLPHGNFQTLNDDIIEMAMWATSEHQCLYNISFEDAARVDAVGCVRV